MSDLTQVTRNEPRQIVIPYLPPILFMSASILKDSLSGVANVMGMGRASDPVISCNRVLLVLTGGQDVSSFNQALCLQIIL